MGRNWWWLLFVAFLLLISVSSVGAYSAQERCQLPDLRPKDLVLSPVSPVLEGTVVYVRATIENTGVASAGEFVIELSWRRLDKQEVCGFKRETLEGLDPKSEWPIEESIDTEELTPGTYEVAVRVDPDNRVEECPAGETNNRVHTMLVVRSPQPELHPTKLSLSPASPVEWGETARISAELENTGESTAGKFYVRYYLYPVVYTQSIPPPKNDDETEEEKAGEPPELSQIGNRGTLPDRVLAFTVTASDSDGDQPTLSVTNVPKGATFTDNGDGTGLFLWMPTYNDVNTHQNIRFEVSDGTHTDFEEITITVTAIDRIPENDKDWILFGSRLVPGLERQERISVEQVLDTAAKLDQLLRAFEDKGLGNIQHESDSTTYAIRVVVDEPSGVQEQDPGNNEIIGFLTVNPSILKLPELRPVSITFDSNIPLEWERDLSGEVLVVNTGGSKANDDFWVVFSFRKLGEGDEEEEWGDEFDRYEIEKEELGIEERDNQHEADFTLDFKDFDLQPGTYELKVEVDPPDKEGPEGKIREQNETNNVLITAFSVQGPELHPVSIDLGAARVHQGDTITVVSQIENTGDKTVKSFTVGFFIDDVRFDTFYYWDPDADVEEGLEKDEIAYAQGTLDTGDLPLGDYNEKTGSHEPFRATLRVIVDPDDQIPELDEANNVISTPLVVYPPAARYAELHPVEVTLEPSSPVPVGQPVSVRATISNSGNIDAERFQVEVVLGYDECESNPAVKCADCQNDNQEGKTTNVRYSCCRCADVEGLSRGSKTVIERTFSTAELVEGKTYRVTVAVDPPDSPDDPFGEIEEMDENNNELVAYFTVGTRSGPGPQDAPNLVWKELTVSPSQTVNAGIPLRICGTIANTGKKDADSFQVAFFRIGSTNKPFATQQISGLGVGQTLRLKCAVLDTSGLRPGTYQIKGVVDAKHEVEEQSEADNERALFVTISGGPAEPDLAPIPGSLRFAPSAQVAEGEPLSAYVTVENKGSLCNVTFDVLFAQAGEAYETAFVRKVGGLRATEERELWQQLDTSLPGTYTLTITVDPDGRITERDEGNNVLTGQFEVTPAVPPKVERILTGGAVRFLRIEETTGTVYATSNDGHLHVLKRGEVFSESLDVTIEEGSDITAFVINPGAARAAYVGTKTGTIYAIGLDSGDQVVDPVPLASTIFDLALDSTGYVYAGTDEGLIRLNWRLEEVSRSPETVDRQIRAIVVDDPRNVVYAITPATLLALDSDCVRLGEVTNLQGNPSALALDARTVFVGTDAGMIYAFDLCDPHGRMRQRYAFAAQETITSIVVDEKGTPYITSSVGKVYVLDSDGHLVWTFPLGEDAYIGGIHSVPVLDDRTGQIFFGDDNGRPYVLTSDGAVAFEVDLAESEAGVIRSTPVIDAVIVRDDMGTRLVRSFYFGTDEGYIYRIQTDR